MASQTPVFKFSRETYTVKVENIADSASVKEIVDLFTALIGEIHKCEENTSCGCKTLSLSFTTQDAAKKALCMSGYTVAGIPLSVTAFTPLESTRNAKQGKQSDNRRNLYVLGLPFDLTKSEFVDIFSRYGTVSHAVILATVDNASRRRGFIVMNSHNEARAAMDSLSRKEIKGHTIDVSWAVVQRSQGFLDGGDRATVLTSNPPSPSPTSFDINSAGLSPPSSQVSLRNTPLPEASAAMVPAVQGVRLLVSNLPAILFSQHRDLYPLFAPFGDVKKLEILESDAADLTKGDISVIVEYATRAQAKDARDALHGQAYSSNPVKAELLPTSDFAKLGLSGGQDTKAGLNPRAAPFVIPAAFSPDAILAPVAQLYADPSIDQNRLAAAIQSGLLALNPYALSPYATPGSLYTHLYVPVAGNVRPQSAPLWADTVQQPLRSGHQLAVSQLQHFPNNSTPSLGQTFTA